MLMTTHLSITDSELISQITHQAVEEIIGPDLSALLFQNTSDPFAPHTEFPHIPCINQTLIDTYGPNGGQGLALRIGRSLFARLLRSHETLSNLGSLSFRVLPLSHRIERGLPLVVEALEGIYDSQGRLEDHGSEIHYVVQNCPDCRETQPTSQPVCFITLGILKEAMNWLSGSREFHVRESECLAMGNEHCRFIINKTPK